MFNIGDIATGIFGSANKRRLQRYQPAVDRINALEPAMQAMTDDELRAQTEKFRARLEGKETLDDLLAEAFATVREVSLRTIGLRHFDVQLAGGIVLHEGDIAEMKTGEGKTLVASLPIYLNALTEKGVHLVTVNDYLAQRDATWIGKIYEALGLSVGVIVSGLTDEQRFAAYRCDVTYATNNELGFDYLRDNMKYDEGAIAQRNHNFAIVDEVDSILIDEARTPLIISGPMDDHSEHYILMDKIAAAASPEHYELDEKHRSALLTESGNDYFEKILKEQGLLKSENLYASENATMVHHINLALRAQKLFQRDKEYIVRNGEIVIIDEFTGRMSTGRRYSDGLHQALEAKEGVTINAENQTLASITYQNYFRLYNKLAGMSGTASTEAEEFADIYKLTPVSIPTNVPVTRIDENDQIYRNQGEKVRAIVELVKERSSAGQPILVGTTSIEKSDELRARFEEEKIPSSVLNARFHEQESKIIALAGAPGTVTIATNMAGRGTDIQMGGNLETKIAVATAQIDNESAREKIIEDVTAEHNKEKAKAIAAGGLLVVGTERHESRRIDNQLRGRSGRQGDPGKSAFFLALDDDLMRIFGSEKMEAVLEKLGFAEGEVLTNPLITKTLENSQKKIEARNYEIRKNLLKFDDVLNEQRKSFFEQRRKILSNDNIADTIDDMRNSAIEQVIETNLTNENLASGWDIKKAGDELQRLLNMEFDLKAWTEEEQKNAQEIIELIESSAKKIYAERVANANHDLVRHLESFVVIQAMDKIWRDHIVQLEHLRHVVGYRGYAQRDPLNEYKAEAFGLFEQLLDSLDREVTAALMRIDLIVEDFHRQQLMQEQLRQAASGPQDADQQIEPEQASHRAARDQIDPENPETWVNLPRNAPCACGSGKKYKHCHGRFA